MEIFLSKRDEATLAVKFMAFNKDDITKFKNLSGRRWLPEESVWSLPYTMEMVEQLLHAFENCKFHVEAQLLEECYLLQSWHNSQKENTSNSPLFAPQWNAAQ